MAYLRNEPIATDDLDISQPKLANNTNAADDSFGINHYKFSDLTANNGKHKYIQFPTSAQPGGTTDASEILFYNGLDAGLYNLYFIPPGKAVPADTIQLTRNEKPSATATGYSWIAGGLLIQWGSSAISANPALTTITFPLQFSADANVFSINISRITADTGTTAQEVRIVSGSVKKDQFKVNSSSSSGANIIYWMAIGK